VNRRVFSKLRSPLSELLRAFRGDIEILKKGVKKD